MPSRREPKANARPVQAVHPLLWVIDPLEGEPTLEVKPMFGGRAVHLHGKFVLFLAAKEEPWAGVLLPLDREMHAPLLAERPVLTPHTVLPKWLYLPEATDTFEADVRWIVQRLKARDPRFGIIPQPKAPRKKRAAYERPR